MSILCDLFPRLLARVRGAFLSPLPSLSAHPSIAQVYAVEAFFLKLHARYHRGATGEAERQALMRGDFRSYMLFNASGGSGPLFFMNGMTATPPEGNTRKGPLRPYRMALYAWLCDVLRSAAASPELELLRVVPLQDTHSVVFNLTASALAVDYIRVDINAPGCCITGSVRVDRGDTLDVLLAPLRSLLELRDQSHAGFRLPLS